MLVVIKPMLQRAMEIVCIHIGATYYAGKSNPFIEDHLSIQAIFYLEHEKNITEMRFRD